MKLLLDTHTLLWLDSDPARLPDRVRAALLGPDNVPHLSIASAWEMAIKVGTGKLGLAVPVDRMIGAHCRERRLELVPVTLTHLAVVAGLPHHHRDPFDRLINAQAMVEGMPVVSADQVFDLYQVKRMWDQE